MGRYVRTCCGLITLSLGVSLYWTLPIIPVIVGSCIIGHCLASKLIPR